MSKFSIVVNDKPLLKKCDFLCDNKLHEKLDKYEQTKFLNCHSNNLFCGKPRQGKTSLLYSYFKSPKLLKKVYDKIYLFQPATSRASMSDKIFDSLPPEQLFEELNYENLSQVISQCKTTDHTQSNAIIFDDMGAYLKDKTILKLMREMIMNRRHLHISVFFLSQTFKSCPKDVRKLFSNIFIFKVSKHELTDIFDELIEHKKADVLEIVKLVFDKPYEYLFINTDTQKMFKGFDEILIQE